jgi:hypothetical protein
MIECRTFSGRRIRYSAIATAADDNNDDRGGTAPLTPSSVPTSRETTTATEAMTTMTTMMTTMTIASPPTIESTGAAFLVPHLTHRGFDVIVFAEQSCAVCKQSADARAFECHRCADVRVFILGQGRRDDGANGVVVGDSGGNVHRGGRGTNDSDSNADDILC